MSQKKLRQEVSVRDAAYHTVHGYPGGCSALAQRMGVGSQVLAHKVNPNNETRYALNLDEAIKAQMFANDYQILHAMARELGHVALQLSPIDDETLNGCMSHTVKAFGEFLSTVSESLEDDRITDSELSRITKQLGHMVNQANALLAKLAAMNEHLHETAPVSRLVRV